MSESVKTSFQKLNAPTTSQIPSPACVELLWHASAKQPEEVLPHQLGHYLSRYHLHGYDTLAKMVDTAHGWVLVRSSPTIGALLSTRRRLGTVDLMKSSRTSSYLLLLQYARGHSKNDRGERILHPRASAIFPKKRCQYTYNEPVNYSASGWLDSLNDNELLSGFLLH